MLRQVPIKVGIALLTLAALIDLQLYAYLYHHPAQDRLGQYLRRVLDFKSGVRAERQRPITLPHDSGLTR